MVTGIGTGRQQPELSPRPGDRGLRAVQGGGNRQDLSGLRGTWIHISTVAYNESGLHPKARQNRLRSGWGIQAAKPDIVSAEYPGKADRKACKGRTIKDTTPAHSVVRLQGGQIHRNGIAQACT